MPSLFKKDELFNTLSMIPGIGMSVWWIFKSKYKLLVPASGYIITCVGSILYHSKCIKNNDNSTMKYLRLDLICQSIGIFSGILYSPLCTNKKLISSMLYISYTSCFLTNLQIERHRLFSFMANGINILIASSFNYSLCMQFLSSSIIFLYNFINKNDYSHAIWHLIVHVVLYQYLYECNLYQLHKLRVTDILTYNYVNLIDHYTINTNQSLYSYIN